MFVICLELNLLFGHFLEYFKPIFRVPLSYLLKGVDFWLLLTWQKQHNLLTMLQQAEIGPVNQNSSLVLPSPFPQYFYHQICVLNQTEVINNKVIYFLIQRSG